MLVPKLRFPEFTNEWNKKNLINIADLFKGNGISKSDISEDGNECILYGELYTTYNEIIEKIKSKTNRDFKSKVLCKYNDVIIPASGETPEDIAKASCILKDNIILGGDLNVIRLKDMDGRFLSYQINNKRKKELANLSQGHSIVHLYWEKFKNINIIYPTKNEQTKIANLLQLLDKKIELQSKKIEVLKLYKKGLYQFFFQKDISGKKVLLGDICDITTGKLDANAMQPDGIFRFYTCASNYYFINEYAFNTEALLISGNGANVGYIHYYKGKFNAYQRTYVLDNFKENIFYIKCYLDKYLAERISFEKKEGNTPYIVLSTLSDMIIKIPNLENQMIIVNISTSINKKISIENKKYNYYIQLKKGLIQKMFV